MAEQKKSLVRALGVSVALCITLFSLAYLYYMQNARQAYRKNARSSANRLAKNIAVSVKVYDIYSLQREIRGSLIAERSSFVKIFDSDSTELLLLGEAKESDCVNQSVDIIYHSEVVGKLNYCLINSSIEMPIRWPLYFLIISIVAMTFLLMTFLKLNTVEVTRLINYLKDIDLDGSYRSDQMTRYRDENLSKVAMKISDVIRRARDHEALEAKRRAQEKVITIARQASHDIQSPLSVVFLASSAISDQELKCLIQEAAEQIRKITSEFKESAENESEKTESIRALIDGVIGLKKIEYPEAQILIAEIFPEIAIQIPRIQMDRIVSNVINNSMEASLDKPAIIELSWERIGREIIIIIRDDGPGIPKALTNSVFQQDFSTKRNGSGLGLYHAKQTLLKYGGDINIRETSPLGTTIELRCVVD